MNKKLFVAIISVGLLSGCFEDLEEREAKTGVQASEEAVAEALTKALEGISILDAKVNQYVSYEDNFRVETNAVMRKYHTNRLLTSIEDTNEALVFRMFQDFYEFDSAGNIKDESHTEVAVPIAYEDEVVQAASKRFEAAMKSMRANAASATLNANDDNACDGKDVTDENGKVYDCIKYFNLKYQVRQVSPPEAVSSRADCGGLPDCKLNIRYISYDEVKWRQGGIVDKLTLRAEVAPQIPDLYYGARNGSVPILSLCLSGLIYIPEAERDYYVTQCKVLRDFSLE